MTVSSFIEQALVFIGSAIVLVPLFQRLGLGSVLGYLIAGVIVGPHGLGLISNQESVMHLSELGVVLLLFLIGLEIQPRKLWSMRRHLLGLGGLQVALCTFIFTLLCWKIGLSFMAASVIGFALSLSSTAFAMQTLLERNQFNTEFGRGSFAILLMQDLLAIPALAVIPLLGVASGNEHAPSVNLIYAFGGMVLLIAGSKYLMRPIFRMIATSRSREVFTAATLFIVLGVAEFMQKVGLSAALGTFFAGVLLADSEYRHELEANLEPFKSLLMGLFFIAVGMSVGLDVVLQNPFFILGLAIAYLVVKMLVIYGVGRLFKLSHLNAKNMALTIGQGGEFAFVIFGIVIHTRLVPDETMVILAAVVTLSMALNPIVNFVEEKINSRLSKINEPRYDTITDETPSVIIAGFGRFGQIFGRILRAQEIPFVAIDHDADHIELVRRFGSKVYYGDTSREDILEAAGAKKAAYFILAIDDVDLSLRTAKLLKEKYPHLKIFARARNRGHAFDLMDLNVTAIKRETFDSSADFVGDLLVDMGLEKNKVTTMIARFKQHDEIMLAQQFKVRKDDKMFLSVSQQGAAQLSQVLNDDSKQSHIAPPPPSLQESVETKLVSATS